MIVLRNLMLAIAAFFVAGAGFYAYLLKALPPDQVIAAAKNASVPQGASAPGSAPSGVAVPGDGQGSGQTEAQGGSRWELAAAVLGDFLAARRTTPGAAGAAETASSPALVVPAWLSQRFDQDASRNGKTVTAEDKAQLLAALLELRTLKQQQLAASSATEGAIPAGQRLPDATMMARAMQAELQFRQTLGIGLAEFMKALAPEDLARLVAMPSSPEPMEATQQQAAVSGVAEQ